MRLSDFLNWVNHGDMLTRWMKDVPGWISTIRGATPAANAPDSVKGLHGILGYGDEREFQLLLIQIEGMEEGSRALIEGFIEWHFSGGNTPLEKMLIWWYANSFRAFVTKMSISNDAVETGTTKTTETSDVGGTKKVTETTSKIFAGSDQNNSVNFLLWMAKTIKSAPTREEGYEQVLKSFRNSNVPHIPEYDWQKLAVFGQRTKDVLRELERSFVAYSQSIAIKATERRARPKSFLERLLVDWKL